MMSVGAATHMSNCQPYVHITALKFFLSRFCCEIVYFRFFVKGYKLIRFEVAYTAYAHEKIMIFCLIFFVAAALGGHCARRSVLLQVSNENMKTLKGAYFGEYM